MVTKFLLGILFSSVQLFWSYLWVTLAIITCNILTCLYFSKHSTYSSSCPVLVTETLYNNITEQINSSYTAFFIVSLVPFLLFVVSLIVFSCNKNVCQVHCTISYIFRPYPIRKCYTTHEIMSLKFAMWSYPFFNILRWLYLPKFDAV